MPTKNSAASPDFERCHIRDGEGWEKLSVDRILDHRYIQIEEIRSTHQQRRQP